MQIVITIDDKDYNDIITDSFRNLNHYERLIANGTPLPKGHGRLGDLDALREEVSSWGMNDYEPSDFIDEIDRADTIIEKDKEKRDADSN